MPKRTDAVPALTVGEDAFERGQVHGRTFARAIADNVVTYLARFAASGMSRQGAFEEARAWGAVMQLQNAEYAEEMAGLARGAAIELEAIHLLNARYEIAFTLFGKDAASREKAIAETDGCTTFGIEPGFDNSRELGGNDSRGLGGNDSRGLGGNQKAGNTWLGQNWDWLEGVHGRTLVLRIKRSKKPSLVCLTEAGIVGGKMGVNEVGIGLVENGLASSHDGSNGRQKPFHMRCREILDADRFEDALRPVVETKRTCSANFVIGSVGGEIIDLETSPDHVTYLHPVDGVITHSNHFVGAGRGDSGHGESQMEKIGPNTLYRAARLRRLLLQRPCALPDLQWLEQVMSDRFGAPNALSRTPDERQPQARRTMTVAGVLIDLDARVLHVANGPPHEHAYVPFGLAE